MVEIKVDGETMSRNYNLPRHRSKVKHGKSDSSDNLYPWMFALTKYAESQGGHGTGKLSQSIVPSAGLQTEGYAGGV